jgi:antitoxin component YwqK of YwqJK toxin-antitoxin module
MIKELIFILFVLLHLQGVSQNDTLNQTVNGKKEGHWIIYAEECDHCKTQEGVFRNDLRIGIWNVYHLDGKTIKLKVAFVDGRPAGAYKKYDANGVLIEEGAFSNGRYYGNFRHYFESGCLESIRNYTTEGTENGVFSDYYNCFDSTHISWRFSENSTKYLK